MLSGDSEELLLPTLWFPTLPTVVPCGEEAASANPWRSQSRGAVKLRGDGSIRVRSPGSRERAEMEDAAPRSFSLCLREAATAAYGVRGGFQTPGAWQDSRITAFRCRGHHGPCWKLLGGLAWSLYPNGKVLSG